MQLLILSNKFNLLFPQNSLQASRHADSQVGMFSSSSSHSGKFKDIELFLTQSLQAETSLAMGVNTAIHKEAVH